MVAMLFCCHFTSLCTSNSDISASAICYIWRFIILQVGLLRLLDVSVVFPVALISLCSFCCNMLSANNSEVVDCDHKHSLLWHSIILQVSSDHRCWGYGPRVPKLGISKRKLTSILGNLYYNQDFVHQCSIAELKEHFE